MDLREVEVLLSELETRTDRLRALYEQYFMGFERLEPTVVRKDVERRMQQLLRVPFRNTALRFRFTMLQQRYNTYQTYWMRTCRQIEEGTYKRQLSRLKAKQSEMLENVEAARSKDKVVEISEAELEELETSPPPPPKKSDKWEKPPAGNTFDTRATVPRMQAVRLDANGKPIVAPAKEAEPAAAPSKPKAPALRPRARDNAKHDEHSRPTAPNLRAVQDPAKK